MQRLISLGSRKLVDNYVELLYGTDIKLTKATTMNADIVNRKLTRVLMGLPISNKNNLDIVEHTIESKRYLLARPFYNIDSYLRRGIYELTGVSYSEYKNMTTTERKIFDTYLEYKMEVANIPMMGDL